MDHFARLLQLLALLQAAPVWTAVQLAERLGTTTRTVRRDVARLRDLGYRIASDPGRYGGYRLDRGRALPPLVLSADEATALAIGLRAAAPAGIDGLDEAATGALHKLEQVLPRTAWERVAALDAATVRPPREAPASVDADVLGTLAAATRDGGRLRLEYRAGDGARSSRRVDPFALVHTASRWYLVAYDVERADWRSFRVDRVLDAAPHGAGALPAQRPDAIAFVFEGTAVTAYPWQAEVVLHLPALRARARVPAAVGRVEEIDEDRCMLRTGGFDLDAVAAFVAGLGCGVEVREPPELVDALHALGRRLLGLQQPVRSIRYPPDAEEGG